jgi:hypothetical protein
LIELPDPGRRMLEFEYQALNQEITQLLETRAFEQRAVEEINRWWADLAQRRSPSELREHLSQSESLLCLHTQTSEFRDHYRRLQTRMAELGQQLGYW